MILNHLRHLHRDFRARVSRSMRTREVVRVLQLAHAKELSETPGSQWGQVRARQLSQIDAVVSGKMDIVDRRSWAFPYLPESLHRLNIPILKATPYNLRRFSETPIPRRAINLVKNAVLSLRWTIRPTKDTDDITPEREKRIQILTETLKRPNSQDSFRTLGEAVLEDLIIGGYGCIEPRLTPNYKRPFKLWAVDGSTIRIFADWTESTPDKPRYAQMTGLKGERGIIAFLDKELIYIKDNNRSSTPFGLGKLEIAFNTVNSFLNVQEMAGRAGADQIHKTFLWWPATQESGNVQRVRRYIQNDVEGMAKVSIISGMQKPEVVDINPVTPADLLLEWQQFLIKIIANAFDLSPIALGIDQHTNKATGQVMADSDFRSAIVPMAKRFEESITHSVVHNILDWRDLEFAFIGLEDPDALTKTQIQQRKYMMNALTPDEIREDDGLPPLPAGWGRLNQGQMQLLILQAQASTKAAAGGAGASSSGGGLGKPPGMGGGMGMGNGNIGAGGFSPDDVASMTPEDIQYLQEAGLLPDTSNLGNEMEEQQPGILETMTYELRDFFDVQEELDDEAQVQPQKISKKDEKEQMTRFKKSLRAPLWRERIINDRGLARPPLPASKVYKNPKGRITQ